MPWPRVRRSVETAHNYDVLRDILLFSPKQIEAYESAKLSREGADAVQWSAKKGWLAWRKQVEMGLQNTKNIRKQMIMDMLRKIDKARKDRGD